MIISMAIFFPVTKVWKSRVVHFGSRTQLILPFQQGTYQSPPLHMQATQGSNEAKMDRNSRRLMIGSTAPTCTFNECRGCKYKCRAEQVPVEGNDPINSAYHYKCVCHRT
ncbi:hypothetical protein V6Z11_D07G222300 [Gossypium hirsutum]